METAEPRRTPGLDQAAALARGLKPIARFICISSALAAAVLGYLLWSWLKSSAGWTTTIVVLLALPALLYAWLWWLLYALADLPTRVHGAVDTFKGMAEREPLPSGAGGFRRLGRILGDLWTVLDQTDNVWLPISATILLINPVGWIVLVVGLGIGFVEWLAALIALLGHAIF